MQGREERTDGPIIIWWQQSVHNNLFTPFFPHSSLCEPFLTTGSWPRPVADIWGGVVIYDLWSVMSLIWLWWPMKMMIRSYGGQCKLSTIKRWSRSYGKQTIFNSGIYRIDVPWWWFVVQGADLMADDWVTSYVASYDFIKSYRVWWCDDVDDRNLYIIVLLVGKQYICSAIMEAVTL